MTFGEFEAISEHPELASPAQVEALVSLVRALRLQIRLTLRADIARARADIARLGSRRA
jgi:hypothetical protein